MGNVKKFSFNPRTLDDLLVKDGLESVSTLNGKEQYFLVGGVATQSYLPSLYRRSTSDIDFAIVRPLSKPDFREMAKPVKEYFEDNGYDVDLKTSNRSRSFAIYASDSKGDSICLEFSRRNKNNFKKHEKRLEREYENCRQKIVEGRDKTYMVSSPEDIAVPKIVRSIGSLSREPSFLKFVPPKLNAISEKGVKRRLSFIGETRDEAVSSLGDPFLSEKLRFISDMYDIRMLSEIVGFNYNYFKIAEGDWHKIESNPKNREKILNVALPNFPKNNSTNNLEKINN